MGEALDKQVAAEIGDNKQRDFYPQVKLQRWGNDANLSVRLVDADPTAGQVSTVGDKTVWSRDGREANFYPVIDAGEDGGFEFSVKLSVKPASPVLEFSLQTKNLVFHYQPELTKEEIKAGDFRPENVIGSYAVYHAAKRDNKYGTGKAFHIYRPWAEDAAGTRVWCDLNIDAAAGLMTITLPTKFWQTAQYPVLVDPTFGYTTAPATESAWTSNRLYGMTGTPASDGTVDSISVYSRVTTGSGNIKAVLVLKSSKVIVTNGVGGTVGVSSTSASWVTATYSTNPSVTNGTAYYVCGVGDTGMDNGRFYFDNVGSSGDALIDTSNNYTTPTDPTDGTTQARQYGFYATYTASGGTTIYQLAALGVG